MADEKYAPMMEHLNELRSVIVACAIAIVIGTVISYVFFIDDLMRLITAPIATLGEPLRFTAVSEGLLAHLKVALVGGVILALPVILWQILKFVLPALYKNERKVFLSVLFFGTVLFVAGVAFGYTFVLKLGLNALLFTFSGELEAIITVNNYLSFVTSFLLPFGIVFEIPLIIYFLTNMGLITPDKLKMYRKYVLLVILILGAILTPPDIVSQILLATPMYILYEISILLSQQVYRRKMKKEARLAKEQPESTSATDSSRDEKKEDV